MQGKIRSEAIALDLARYELSRSGLRINMERIPMELLILLVQSRGRLLTRSEIIDHLWGKNPWLDADRNLNTAIGKIRRALGDDPNKPHFIETAVGKGYRFIAPVRTATESDDIAVNGNTELVILDSSPLAVIPEANGKPAIRPPEAPDGNQTDQSDEKRQTTRRALAFGAWLAAGMLFLSLSLYGWKILDQHGWIIHRGDTSVWIKGDWLVGEYRQCQMKKKEQASFQRRGELPTLFCGEDADGLFEFQATSASIRSVNAAPDITSAPGGGTYRPTAGPPDTDHRFHVMQVGYFGRTDRSDKPIISWRCSRDSDSLTCHAID